MKEQPLSHEEIRQLMLEQFEERIEQIAVSVATEFYPDRDFHATVDQIKAAMRKKIETVMRPEDRLYLMPAPERVS